MFETGIAGKVAFSRAGTAAAQQNEEQEFNLRQRLLRTLDHAVQQGLQVTGQPGHCVWTE